MYISLIVLISVNFNPVVPDFCFPFPVGLYGVDGERQGCSRPFIEEHSIRAMVTTDDQGQTLQRIR